MAFQNPSFYTKNQITEVSSIVDSDTSPSLVLSKLIDGNNGRPYSSTTQNAVTITVTNSSTINRIALFNTNASSFTIKYDTNSDFSTPISVSSSSDKNFYFTFNSQAITNIVLTVTATQTVGDLVSIGQIYIGTELFELDSTTIKLNEDTIYGIQPVKQDIAQVVTLSDKTTKKISIRQLMQYEIGLAVNDTDLTNFEDLETRNVRETFYYIHRPATQPDTFNGQGGNYNLNTGIQIGQKKIKGIEGNPSIISGSLIQAGGL